MTHVFVAPHPDDVALSCGGLVASLRDLGQSVTILTVFSGATAPTSLSAYQREVLGFGTKAVWPDGVAFNRANLSNDYPDEAASGLAAWEADPGRLEATQAESDAAAKRFWQRSSWYRRADVYAHSLAGQPVIDELPSQGAVLTDELTEAEATGDSAAARRLEDERYAYFAEASVVFLDLPDAVSRGYEGDDALLSQPHPNDRPPLDVVRREIARLEPQQVYFPLGVGGHVDHQLLREVGLALVAESRRWVMPGPDYVGRLVFYEDFPYAYWSDFNRLEDLPPGALASLPPSVSLTPEYCDVSESLETKVNGVGLYRSQLDRLFGGRRQADEAVRAAAVRLGRLAAVAAAERYWRATSI